MPKPRIAVLALQGDFQKHIDRFTELDADAYAARLPEDIQSADAIVLPGGESTTIGKLLSRFNLMDKLAEVGNAGKPIFGTCAGLILLASNIRSATAERGGQPTLNLLDITVSRNAFGRQIDSFEAQIEAPTLVKAGQPPLSAVFIRAPIVESIGPEVEVIARHDGKIVFVRQKAVLGASFHPELTPDTRVHEYFLDIVARQIRSHDGIAGS